MLPLDRRKVDGRIVFLVYTMRGDTIRFISGKPAMKREFQR